MGFFNIMPRTKEHDGFPIEDSIPLKVVFKDGVKTKPDIDFDKIDLAGGSSIFKNNSGINDSFSVTVLLHDEDDIRGGRYASGPASMGAAINLINALDYWIRNAVPFYVRTDAVGIPRNVLWLVTEQKNRKQDRKEGYVEWDLTFTKYEEVSIGNFNVNTDVINKALEKKKTTKTTGKNTNSKTQLRNKIKKCKNTSLVYSEKKKIVQCVKYMQELLYLEGSFPKNTKKTEAIDGWYGKTTRTAVKNYKTKYKKDYGLNTYGNNVDYKTWQVMCGTAKKLPLAAAQDKLKQAAKNRAKTISATIKTNKK